MKQNYLAVWAAALMAAGLLVLVGVVRAEPPADGKGANRPDNKSAQRIQKLIERFNQAVKPTDEQQPQLEQIWQTHQQSMRNWMQEHRQELEAAKKKLREAGKNNDKNSRKAAGEELKKIRASHNEIIENLLKQMEDVLTAEQMKKAKTVLKPLRNRGKGPLEMLEKLNLTEQQKQKVEAILDDAADQGKKTDDKQLKRRVMAEAFEKIRDTVLTAEQKEKFQAALKKRFGRSGGPQHEKLQAMLNLTDEQKNEQKQIMDEARKAADKAKTPTERRKIRRDARKKINQEVWTDEQRATLKKHLTERRNSFLKDKIGLTDEQIAQSEKIMAKAHKAAEKTENDKDRRKIIRDARKKVHDEVWTDEQREKFEQQREERKSRRKDREN